MLQGDFFHITTLETAGNTISAMLEINPAHPVFGAIFRGNPSCRRLHDADGKGNTECALERDQMVRAIS